MDTTGKLYFRNAEDSLEEIMLLNARMLKLRKKKGFYQNMFLNVAEEETLSPSLNSLETLVYLGGMYCK